jgi:sugar O-acyltransferase (sialic acid O-acetyltransferase NeuD family)
MAPDPRPLVIVGAGGHAREALDILEAIPGHDGYRVVGFVSDPREDEDLLERRGHRILGPVEQHAERAAHVVLAVGSGADRRSLAVRLTGQAVSLVHPAATVDPAVRSAAGPGLVVAAGAHLAGGVTVGEHVHVNTNAVVGRGAVLGSYVTVSPGAVVEPDARLGPGCLVGAGARVAAGVRLGDGCVVGAGASVEEDAEAATRLVGVPARPR